MNAWTVTTAALVLLAVGYVIGRYRPYQRLGDWADWQLRFHLNRWTSRPRQAALFALLLLTDPVRTVDAWRHRKDPPPPLSPAVRINGPRIPDHTVNEES
ncbi:hypothetical protein OIE75_40980 (plasmid) [Streptomyces sp. NBC_01723]|uniref:hypothetical protein n=1 Tax=Streptomyces sp. NBC_01723 TaxID=2975921 RepID=UPI002E35C9EE|nr:hypothetical protein [Streptomyces sp. NBC_01723]